MKTPAVVLVNPKYPHNVAAAIRACSCFGVSSLQWTGTRVSPAEYERLPREERMKGYKDVKWYMNQKPFDVFEESVTPVCVELTSHSTSLHEFEHPDNAVYIFGPEDGGVPQVYRRMCHRFIYIPSHHCLNLAAALNVVLYDRFQKKLGPNTVLLDILHETRGELEQPGWEGR
jgi:tRNA(Leu) C34 or U34 (ribose-2'-O)-methylase TrmL